MCFCGDRQHRRFICPRLLSSDDASTFAERKKKKGRRWTKRRERIYSPLPPVRSPEGGCPQSYSFSLSPALRSIPFRAEMGAKSFPVPPSLLTTQRNCAVPTKKSWATVQYHASVLCSAPPPARRQEDRGDSAECLCVVQSTQYPSPLFSPERMRGKTMCVLCRCVGLSQDG